MVVSDCFRLFQIVLGFFMLHHCLPYKTKIAQSTENLDFPRIALFYVMIQNKLSLY